MTHPLTPREKVRKAIIDVMKPKDADITLGRIDTCTDAILTALASGSGDHAELARRFHDTYERLAPKFGYETRSDTKSFDPESPNGRLMAAVCGEVQVALLAEIAALRADTAALDEWRGAAAVAHDRATEAERTLAEADKQITMDDVRLAAGEGVLGAGTVLAAVNAILRTRSRTFLSKEAERG